MPLRLLLVCVATSAAISTTVGQGRFSIEQVMSAPFPTDLVASSDGNRVAWVQNAAGERNVWVADGPAFVSRAVTGYRGDDGQEISDLAFTAAGDAVVYVRGGAPNRHGEIPNPTSTADWAERAIWIVPLTGGTPRRLAEGSSPAVSPQGDRVVFLRGGAVWSVLVADTAEAKQLFTIRGTAGSLRWSPDGSRLAFVSARGDHSFVGVYSLTDHAIRYMAPSIDRDANPTFSPDGSQLAFTRTPNIRDALPFEPRREAHPWSIVVADVATGRGRVVWTADPGSGSVFRGIAGENQVLWGEDDWLVFPWEKTGWLNLYAVRARSAAGSAVALTPGRFEVEDVTLTPDRREIVYTSNQDDIDRRDIWKVRVAGGPVQAITRGEDIEWSPVVTSAGATAYLASSARMPAHARILEGSESRPLAPQSMPADFPSAELVEPQPITFSAADGMPIRGQLFLPPTAVEGRRHPAVIFFHGGSRRQMLLGFHYLGYYHHAYSLNQYLASQGYVVLSVNYRSGTGYGMEFREAIDYGAKGASEFNDVLGAGLYLRNRPDVDPRRIGLWGGSYGGYLTALGLARASDLFAAGVDIHGVHDWNVVVQNFVPGYDAAARSEWARVAFEASPMADIASWRSPVLLIHGDDDRNVPFGETVDLVESLRRQGVEFEQLVFPDEVHGFLLHRNWIAAYQATADFFDRKLQRTATNGS